MKAFNQPIRDFLKEAASNSPTPGGGAIASLSAALGVSMGSMVAHISLSKNINAGNEKIVQFIEIAENAMAKCENFLEEDKRCFNEYMKVLKMSKATEEEKNARAQALSEASELAADIPAQLMEFCLSLLQKIEKLSLDINKNVASDLGISAILMEASIQSAWITVEINLKGIKNEQTRIKYQETGLNIVHEAKKIKERILMEVRRLI